MLWLWLLISGVPIRVSFIRIGYKLSMDIRTSIFNNRLKSYIIPVLNTNHNLKTSIKSRVHWLVKIYVLLLTIKSYYLKNWPTNRRCVLSSRVTLRLCFRRYLVSIFEVWIYAPYLNSVSCLEAKWNRLQGINITNFIDTGIYTINTSTNIQTNITLILNENIVKWNT